MRVKEGEYVDVLLREGGGLIPNETATEEILEKAGIMGGSLREHKSRRTWEGIYVSDCKSVIPKIGQLDNHWTMYEKILFDKKSGKRNKMPICQELIKRLNLKEGGGKNKEPGKWKD